MMIDWLQTVDFTRPNFYIFDENIQANNVIGMIIMLFIVLFTSRENPALINSQSYPALKKLNP